jgi:uncharacterized metal-binding protein YceD (DUF177 family)
VSWKSKYNIEFKGLKEGLHEFEFEVKNSFFEHFEESLVEKGDVKALIILERRSSFLNLHFKITGILELTCDRCLEPYEQKIGLETDIFVKFGHETEDNSDNVLWLLPEEHQLNVAQLIYEYTVLSIPMRHVHPKNDNGVRACNKEMIEKLKELKAKHIPEESETDPRWDLLKKLNNN